MTTKERLLSALRGGGSTLPLAAYDILWDQAGVSASDERLQQLQARGLGLISHVETTRTETPNVQTRTEKILYGGQEALRRTLVTPVGEMSCVLLDGWVQEYYLKTPDDYRVMEYAVRDQRITADYDAYFRAEQAVGDMGVVCVTAQRTPYQKMLVDLAGLENFSYHLADGFPELTALYEALLDKHREIIHVVAAGPGKIVKIWENLTGDAVGPDRFQQYHLPVYREITAALRASGKLLALHYDGRLACLKNQIGEAEFDIVESFTPPPEGDLEPSEALAAWPGKALWLTLPSHIYRSERELRAYIHKLKAASAGHSVVPEIAEYFPAEDWERQLSLLLDALSEY